jgi:hypothetical protein
VVQNGLAIGVRIGAKQPEHKIPHSKSFAERAEEEKGKAQLKARSQTSGGWIDARAQKLARPSHESRHAGHGRPG